MDYIKDTYKTEVHTFVSDNCETMLALGRLLQHRLWRSGCHAHIGNLLTGDLVNVIVSEELRGIQKFFKRTSMEVLVREKGGKRVKLGSSTRWCYYR